MDDFSLVAIDLEDLTQAWGKLRVLSVYDADLWEDVSFGEPRDFWITMLRYPLFLSFVVFAVRLFTRERLGRIHNV